MEINETRPVDDPLDNALWEQIFQMHQLPPGSAVHRTVRPFDICLQDPEGGRNVRISKIIPYPDGGFAVLAPFHKSKRGMAYKYRHDYRLTRQTIGWADMATFSASDRLKLSVHPDGFVQFSGENPGRIVSGRDPITGVPKGLGVISNPFRSPVYSGPTFNISVWGLRDYPDWNRPLSQNVMLFEAKDIYFNDPGGNAYAIEGYVYTRWLLPHIRVAHKEPAVKRITLPLWRYDIRGSRIWDYAVLPGIGAPQVIVALRVSRYTVAMGVDSGFALNGPAELTPNPVRWILSAVAPPPPTTPKASLDYSPTVNPP